MSDSIGARLRQARELRHLTLEQASETTKLRTHYLQALENDDYSAIPSAPQARGFLRLYAEFLQLDVAELLPAAPVQPAPAAAAAPPTVAASPSGPANFLSALRKRFSRTNRDEAAPDLPLSAATDLLPQPTQDAAASAASEAQTVRRPASDSPEVKKNALGS